MLLIRLPKVQNCLDQNLIMRFIIAFLFLLTSSGLLSQVQEGLESYFTFDNVSNGDFLDETAKGTSGKIGGPATLSCGVKGNAFNMDGVNNFVVLVRYHKQLFLQSRL